jgi:cytochrome d ubiquinol oxidase subunit II
MRRRLVVELWFGIAAVMLAAYVVMDGFDFGAGALHLFVARNDAERRQVLAAIGPFWDGNEVFLLASGGVLFVAFPKVLAAGLSGFYFAIFLVLWTLILRGIAIEFRSHGEHPLWRTAWDFVFGVASTLLPVLFGAALGNLLRGLPLNQEGWFSLPLFTDFTTGGEVGILDWYTVLVGVFALVAIIGHGGTYLTWKTDGAVLARSRLTAMWCYGVVAVLWPIVTMATASVNGRMYDVLLDRPFAWLSLLVALGGLVSVALGLRGNRPLQAFLGSSAFLAGLLAATAALVFPVMLRATGGEELSLTAYNSAVPAASLRIALGWWVIAAPLAVTYFIVLFRLHRGKAVASRHREGY